MIGYCLPIIEQQVQRLHTALLFICGVMATRATEYPVYRTAWLEC